MGHDNTENIITLSVTLIYYAIAVSFLLLFVKFYYQGTTDVAKESVEKQSVTHSSGDMNSADTEEITYNSAQVFNAILATDLNVKIKIEGSGSNTTLAGNASSLRYEASVNGDADKIKQLRDIVNNAGKTFTKETKYTPDRVSLVIYKRNT